jgi:vacuolar-type H+-ATPase subunit F/Vma7
MARLAVLCGPQLADGFRLAGVRAHTALPGRGTRVVLHALLEEPDLGLLLVTEDLWASLDERTRGTLEYLPRPLVLSIPAGTVTEVGARRELLGEMLERAIGYRIELSGEGWGAR